MELWTSILKIMNTKMTTPTSYGWFHILCLLLCAGLTILAVSRGKKADEKTVRRVVLLTAALVAVLEVYKQINYTFGSGDRAAEYQWYAFPFQFCSTPMYVGLLTGIFRKGKIHDALCAYLATYAVFAGVCVMFYPGDVFISTVGINIQTMVCHGSMPVIGAWLLASGHVKAEPRTIFKALPVFVGCVLIAMGLNEIAHLTGLLESHTFNMFFISPYCAPSLAVYSLVQQALPYPLCLVVYVLGFTAAAFVMLMLAVGLRRLRIRRYRPALAPAVH